MNGKKKMRAPVKPLVAAAALIEGIASAQSYPALGQGR
jgi:hypothetical protein